MRMTKDEMRARMGRDGQGWAGMGRVCPVC
jgi:hypothetical protein